MAKTLTIKMLAKITGTRNGIDWPEPGETIELPEAEAESLIASKLAKPAAKTSATLVAPDHVDHATEAAEANAAKRAAAAAETADDTDADDAESTVLTTGRVGRR
jgi:hypothetical protein